MTEKRCCSCNKLLAKASLQQGKVEIKCPCGTINTFSATTEKKQEGRSKIPYVKPSDRSQAA